MNKKTSFISDFKAIVFSALLIFILIFPGQSVFARTPAEIRNQEELNISQDMSSQDLSGNDFVKLDLKGINFSESNLTGAVFNNSKLPNLFLNNWSWHRYQKVLDEVLMSTALQGMEGEHDFFAFQKSGSNRSTSITTIKNIQLKRVEDLILIDIKATGFLYGMVRLIVGQLVLVGEKKISPETFTNRWVDKKKNDVKESAPAKGLCFVNAVYKDNVFKNINKNDLFPEFVIKGYS